MQSDKHINNIQELQSTPTAAGINPSLALKVAARGLVKLIFFNTELSCCSFSAKYIPKICFPVMQV